MDHHGPRDRVQIARRQAAVQAAPGYKEERLRGVEATFLLGDLRALYKDPSVLRYEVADYQLPLLAANARYRCAGSFSIRGFRPKAGFTFGVRLWDARHHERRAHAACRRPGHGRNGLARSGAGLGM